MTNQDELKKADNTTLSAGDRVAYLLRVIWQGNQQRMALDLGFSQPLISKVVNGHQAPGRKLLAALAARPGIDPAWLMTGAGAPPRSGSFAVSTMPGQSLPTARHLIPGPPDRFTHLLSVGELPVASADSRPSRYWYVVTADDSNAFGDMGFRPRDLLLMETDPKYWQPNLMVLNDAICAVTVDGPSGPVCLLSRVHVDRGTGEVRISVSGKPDPVAKRAFTKQPRPLEFFPDTEDPSGTEVDPHNPEMRPDRTPLGEASPDRKLNSPTSEIPSAGLGPPTRRVDPGPGDIRALAILFQRRLLEVR